MYTPKHVFPTRKLEPVLFLNFSPDGKYIAAAFTSGFTIWSLENKENPEPFHLGQSLNDRVVAQDWTLDGLCTIFASGWVSTATITPKFSFVPFGFRMHTILRHQQPTKEPIELAAVDFNGTRLAVASGRNVIICSRRPGKAEWFHQETFSVPLDTLDEVPFAKNIAWIEPSAGQSTSSQINVIYVRTWSTAPSVVTTRTRLPSSVNRPETEVFQAAVAPDGSKTLLVLAKKSGDQPTFRIYNQPSFVLEATLAAADPPGPAIFCTGSTVIVSVNHAVTMWEVNKEGIWTAQAKLTREAVSVPVTSIAHHCGVIATAQEDRIVIWESTQHRYTQCAKYAKSSLLVGVCLGVLAFLFPVLFKLDL